MKILENFNKSLQKFLRLKSSKLFSCHKKLTSNYIRDHEELHGPLKTKLLEKMNIFKKHEKINKNLLQFLRFISSNL